MYATRRVASLVRRLASPVLALPPRRWHSTAVRCSRPSAAVESPRSVLPTAPAAGVLASLALQQFTPKYQCHRCLPAFFRTHPRFYQLASAAMSAAAGTAQAEPVYKLYPKDFGPLTTKPLHLDLEFDMETEVVTVTARTTFLRTVDEPLRVLRLNSNNLEIKSVELLTGFKPLAPENPTPAGFVEHVGSFASGSVEKVEFQVDDRENFLILQLPRPIAKGEQFVVRTVSTARPTKHILEGIYYDYTPDGAPQTMITQCQQYGFRRIVPSIDEMTAKAYYTTRIIASKQYTHIITNGDFAPGFFDPTTGQPLHQPVPGREGKVCMEYHNHLVNMASYLFFLGCGTYQTYRGEFEYCDGKTAIAELLVFPGLVEERHAKTALQSLIDSIMWCYLSTGPEATEHNEERAKIYELIKVRDQLKATKTSGNAEAFGPAQEEALAKVRAELKQLISVWKKTGYVYTGQIYREISMQNSDYGGMENVGNTTILASRMVPSALLVDPGYIYMEGVKIHEYYHNINGSQVTGQSPFQIWLNEAVTVYIQRQRENMLFGADYMRLKEVLYSFTPGQGPLAIDAGENAMPIEPKGFNRTQELISAMTYSKAPEVVNMIADTIGEPNFNRGLDLYHERYKYANATTDDWIRCMEEASGQELMPMASLWLRRSGHPHVLYSGVYDATAKTYTVQIEQTRLSAKDPRPWMFPIDYALVKNGKNIHEGLFHMTKEKDTLVIREIDQEPDFLSFARGWSFFGTYANTTATTAQLSLQALTDPDVIGRYFAYRKIVDTEKAAIIEKLLKKDTNYTVSPEVVKLHATILFDANVNAGARASILREGEDIHTRPDLQHHYWEISDARRALLQAVFDAHGAEVLDLYNEIESRNRPGPHIDQLHDRSLKHHLFTILAVGLGKSILSTRPSTTVKADISGMARDLFTKSTFMSDRVFAFSQFLQGPASADDKRAFMDQVKGEFAKHPDSLETYIGVLAGLDSDDAPQLIRALIADPLFQIAQACHARTVVRAWASLRKRSLLTEEGLALTSHLFTLVGKVNQYSAQSFISALNDLAKFDAPTQKKLVTALREMKASLDPVKEESLSNQLTNTLAPYKDI